MPPDVGTLLMTAEKLNLLLDDYGVADFTDRRRVHELHGQMTAQGRTQDDICWRAILLIESLGYPRETNV